MTLSVLTSNGFDGLNAIKWGQVKGQRVVLTVDSGATHCFVAELGCELGRWVTGKLEGYLQRHAS